MHDDGPSPDDIARFNNDSGYCPECGETIYDQAEICPACHAYIGGHTLNRPPVAKRFEQRWIALVAIVVLLAFLLIVIR
jgi:predicted amidophosphoribosyltransferase